MSRIEGAEALAALMRRQIEALARAEAPAAGAAAVPTTAGERARAAPRRARAGKGDLASVVARRVHALDGADPDAPRQAFRIFLESVLLAELGDELINDPAFYRLVDDVIARMESDSELAPLVARASTLLLQADGRA